ncbi:MAG: hypothetical protein ACXAB8_11130 [Promethearchaeota archaeon]
MRHLPVEYRLCCECRNLIKHSAVNRLTYLDVCNLIDDIAVNPSKYITGGNNDYISNLEISFLSLISITPTDEIQALKTKFKKYFYNLQHP